jgi:serine/threonine protein kinase
MGLLQNADDAIKELKGLEIAKSLCHKHILSVVMTYEELDTQKRSYGIILEPVADRNLQDYLEHANDSTPPHQLQATMQKWFGCLASGLAFLHAKCICHKNVKPSNILVRGDDIFLAEFGISQYFKDTNMTTKTTFALWDQNPMLLRTRSRSSSIPGL